MIRYFRLGSYFHVQLVNDSILMNRHFLAPSSILVALLIAGTSQSFAQSNSQDRGLFVKPMAGFANYMGDNDTGLDFSAGEFPWNFGAEIGYTISPQLSISAAVLAGNYPTIGTTDFKRYSGLFLLRYTLTQTRFAPFFDLGVNGTTNNPDGAGFGPAGGLGLEFAINEQSSLLLEWIAALSFPDDAADNTRDIDFGSFDLLNGLMLGVKFKLQGPTPPQILSTECPISVEVDDPVTFSALINTDASKPLEYRWDWGDGTSAAGLHATHSYQRSGSYTVTFSASNRAGTDVSNCTVVVETRLPAEIISVNATPNPADVGQIVTFSTTARGDTPITYRWDFGDGSMGEGSNPTYTYSSPGIYTVSLIATNGAGSDTRSINLQINPIEAAICQEITEMNVAYFNRNSSTLTEEALETLQDNLEILLECPNMIVRLEGYAAPGERNVQLLSEDRARAVEQFYTRNGVAPSRLSTIGRGQVLGTTSKKEGTSQFRRVDTIPLR